jgi:Flp pilus assembly pilin Flp
MSNLLLKVLLAANLPALRAEEGQTVTEYAIVIGLIVVGAIAVLTTIGQGVLGNLQDLAKAFN